MSTQAAPTPLNRLDILRGLNISVWEGVWATIWMVLTTGAFQTGFAQHEVLATPFALGLMAGLPAAVNLLQIPASLYVERRGERRTFIAFTAVMGRLLWLPILLIPFLLPPEARLFTYLALVTASAALMSLSVPAWTSWMSDLVPAGSRGEYFARRNQVAGLVAMLVPLPAGAFLDQAVKYGRFEPRIGFAVLFGIACVAAIGSCVLILRQPEPPMARPEGERPNPLKSLRQPLADPNFRPFIVYAAMTVVGQTLAGQFFVAWQVGEQGLNQPYLAVQLLGTVTSLAGLLTTPLWGYLADKFGSRPVLVIATTGTVLAPLIWMLTVPNAFWWNVAMIILLNLCSGIAWAGVGLTQFNLLLGLTEPAARSSYVAVYSALTGVVGGIAPIVGGLLMTALESVAIPLGPLVINNYKILFFITACLRVGCVFLLRNVPVGDSRSTRYVLEQLAASRPWSSYLTARRLSRPTTEVMRRQAVEELADLRSPLAVEELTNALEDVSPEVRERAVEALAAIRDPRAIPALGSKLLDPTAGLGERAAGALGQIGHSAAAPYLIAAAHGPDAVVRLASIKALGQVSAPREHPESISALRAALTPVHPTACEAACLSLATLAPALSGEQTAEIIPALVALLEPEVARGMRFAANRTLGGLHPLTADARHAFEGIHSRAIDEPDRAVLAQAVVALARLGRSADKTPVEVLRAVLPLFEQVGDSGLAYKQTLSAIADIALEPGTFYPYLGLAEMARDEAASRLISELRETTRRQGKSPTSGGNDAGWFDDLLSAYTEGEYASFHARLAELPTPDQEEAVGEARLFLSQFLAERSREREGGAEEACLALLLVRSNLDIKK